MKLDWDYHGLGKEGEGGKVKDKIPSV